MSASGQAGKKDSIYWANTAITLLLMFGVGYLEPWGSLNELGMKVLGIFLGMLWGWTAIGFVWPSLMGLLALGLSGYQSVSAAIAAGFGATNNTVLCIFLFVFAAYMDRIGLSQLIAHWFISRKIAIGRPYVFSFMVFLAAYVLGATVSLFTGILLLWNIFYSACQILGYKKKEKYPTIMLVGIVYSAMLGFAIFPFKATQVMVLGSLATVSGGSTIDFMDFTSLTFCITVGCLVAFLAIMKYVIRPDISKFADTGDMFGALRQTNINNEQKIAAFFLVLFMFAMFAPSVLPKDFIVAKFFNDLGITGSLVFVMALMAMLKIKGKISFNFADAAQSGMNWNMILLFAATMPVSAAMSSEETGVINFIVELLEPLFLNFSGFTFCIAFIVVAGILTQVAHNLVLAALLTPVMYQFSIQLGGDPLLMSVLFAFAIAVAIATPGGSAPGALIYTNSEWIEIKDAYKYGCLAAGISIIMSIVIGLPLGSLIF